MLLTVFVGGCAVKRLPETDRLSTPRTLNAVYTEGRVDIHLATEDIAASEAQPDGWRLQVTTTGCGTSTERNLLVGQSVSVDAGDGPIRIRAAWLKNRTRGPWSAPIIVKNSPIEKESE